MLIDTLINGLVSGGAYALVAIGLTLQYGIARLMNLAFGDLIVTACFLTFVLFSAFGVDPVIGVLVVAPAGFAFSYAIYALIMHPLVKRAPNSDALEVDSILATFGLLFVIQGVLQLIFGGNYTGYTYLSVPVSVFGTIVPANRLLALGLALALSAILAVALMKTRWGTTLRAVAVAPNAAPLVGINLDRTSQVAFALGGALAAAGGAVISMYQTFTPTMGVVFTMKALIVVILGGKGSVPGALIAGLILGLVETFVAAFIDPGLTLASTYLIFLALLLLRPSGLFGRKG